MADFSHQQLWLNAFAVIPVAMLALFACRWLTTRPATRHAVWVIVLSMFLFPSLLVGLIREYRPLASLTEPQTTETLDTAAGGSDEPRSIAQRPRSQSEVPNFTEWGGGWWAEPQNQDTEVLPAIARWNDLLVVENELPTEQPGELPVEQEVVSRPLDQDDSTLDTAGTNIAQSPTSPSVTEEAGPATGVFADISAWSTYLITLRNTLAQIPPLPAAIWLGGIALVIYFFLLRLVRMQRVLRQATSAPPDIRDMVRRAASGMNVKHHPDVVMTDERVSPMLWCGRTKQLVLPTPLWDQLDEASRLAIVCHELAHLKRRDHWVCWVEMLVGLIYWWHPLVWWLRKRIREEADYCCDLWVTHFLPRDRRRYAEALLESRKYISADSLVGPALGLGASTNHAQQFARRITMVMTDQFTPRLSVRGVGLVLTIAAAAALVAPITACPPDQKPTSRVSLVSPPGAATAPSAPGAPDAPWAASEPAAPIAPDAPWAASQPETAPEPGSTFERFMQDPAAPSARSRPATPRRAGVPATAAQQDEPPTPQSWAGNRPARSGDDLERRIERLERQIDRLMQLLEQRNPRGAGATDIAPEAASNPFVGRGGVIARSPRADGPSRSFAGGAVIGRAPRADQAPSGFGGGVASGGDPGTTVGGFSRRSDSGITAGGGGGFGGPTASGTVVGRGGGGIVTRAPRATDQPARGVAGGGARVGTAEAPTRGLAGGGVVTRSNRGTGSGGGFFTPEAGANQATVIRRYYLDEGKLKELSELMLRQDVPILVSPDDKYIEVHATPANHSIFKAFCEMIQPEGVKVEQKDR